MKELFEVINNSDGYKKFYSYIALKGDETEEEYSLRRMNFIEGSKVESFLDANGNVVFHVCLDAPIFSTGYENSNFIEYHGNALYDVYAHADNNDLILQGYSFAVYKFADRIDGSVWKHEKKPINKVMLDNKFEDRLKNKASVLSSYSKTNI